MSPSNEKSGFAAAPHYFNNSPVGLVFYANKKTLDVVWCTTHINSLL